MSAPTKTHGDLHLQRKLFHFSSVFLIFLCMTLFDETTNWLIYLFVGLPALTFDIARQNSTQLNTLALKLGGPLLREAEVKQLSGASYALIAIGMVYFLFPKPIAQMAVLFLAVGDPIASFFGLLYGKHILFGKKSLEGFLAAFAFCATACTLYLMWQHPAATPLALISLSCGVIAATSELIPVGKLDDNLTQPLISASLMSILFSFLGGFLS